MRAPTTRRTPPSAPTAERRGLRALILALLAAAALAAAWIHDRNPALAPAEAYAAEVAAGAAGLYVTLRSLNAVLSTAQEVEVSGNVVFAGGSAQPFKVLEPIDDTIERVASVVFAVMLATGALAVAMAPVGAVGFAMMGGAALLWAADVVFGRRDPVAGLGRRLFWYGAFLALALPAAFVISAALAERLTGEVAARNDAVIAEITADIGTAPAEDARNPFLGALEDADRYRELVGNVYARADDLIASYIALLGVYLFRILILPALILGAFLVVARHFAHRDRPGTT